MKLYLKILISLGLMIQSSAYASGLAVCSLSTSTLNFGLYNPISGSPSTITGSLTVNCTGLLGLIPVVYTLSLSQGNGTFSNRVMKGVGGNLTYNIYTTATFNSVWGDGTGGTSLVNGSLNATILGASQNVSVYGQIPSNQLVPAGTYTDNLVVNMSF